jgi:hypothetical protein
METMKSLPPPMTLVAPPTPQSHSFARKCAGVAVKALKDVANGYVEAAQYNAFWIGCPGADVKE